MTGLRLAARAGVVTLLLLPLTMCTLGVGQKQAATPQAQATQAPLAPPQEPPLPQSAYPAVAPIDTSAPPLPPPTDTTVTAATPSVEPPARTTIPGFAPPPAVTPAPAYPAVGAPVLTEATPVPGQPAMPGQPATGRPGQPGAPVQPGMPGQPGVPGQPAAPMDMMGAIRAASAQGRVMSVEASNKRGIIGYEVEVMGAGNAITVLQYGATGPIPAVPGKKPKSPKFDPKVAAAASVAKVTIEQAIATAQRSFPGTVESAELSASKGLATWVVELRNNLGQKAKIKVDAGTGQVVLY